MVGALPLGQSDQAPPCGLYVDESVGLPWQTKDQSVGIGPITLGEAGVGLRLEVEWFRASLLLAVFRGTPTRAINPQSIRHVPHVRVESEVAEHRIEFMWNEVLATESPFDTTPQTPASDGPAR